MVDEFDVDGDGAVDLVFEDTDGDGWADRITSDMDGDGALDTVFDVNTLSTYTIEETVEPPVDPVDPVDQVYQSTTYQQWQESAGVVGEVSDADFWFRQTGGTCGVASVAQVISDFTGDVQVDEAALLDWVVERGFATGTPDDCSLSVWEQATVLTEWGIPSSVAADLGIEDISAYLAEGRSVLLQVDSDDYWTSWVGAAEGAAPSVDFADHMIRIVAIDHDRGVAILSDTGTTDGQALEVPLTTLEEAWSAWAYHDDYGNPVSHVAVVSDVVDPTLGSAAVGGLAGAEPGPLYSEKGFAILPVTLAESRILAALNEN